MSQKFVKDLLSGKEIEAKVINYFETKGMKLLDWNSTNEFDFLMEYKGKKLTFEVKSDFYKTDNMIFEFEYKNRPSGIATTKAMWFVYYFYHNSELWIIKTNALRKLCKYAPEKIDCGEFAKAYRFNKHDICFNFVIRTIK